MGSPSSSFNIFNTSSDDDFSDRELEAVSVAAGAVATYVAQNPPKPIQRRLKFYRDRFDANERLMKDYFHPTEPTYDDRAFRRRFRMSKRLFLRIANDLEAHFDFFKQKPDGLGVPGFTSIQKCTAAMRVIGYGVSTDINDEYLKMADKTCRDTLEHFTIGIKTLYEKRYLRKPTKSDLMKIYDVHQEVHGIPGMMGSIDCMHWAWANCPTAWRGQYHGGSHKGPTLVLQAVCSYDLWIWSAYFGVPGSLNDINILEQSPVLEDIISGTAPSLGFYANDNFHPGGYFLGDGIYPEYSFIMKTMSQPIDPKKDNWRKVQESARKDIERCFGVLKKRFAFVANPCRLWTKDKIKDVMRACLILHNMILEDEGRAFCQDYHPGEENEPLPGLTPEEAVQQAAYVRSHVSHHALLADLIEEAWVNRKMLSDEEEEEEEEEEENYNNYDDVNDDSDD